MIVKTMLSAFSNNPWIKKISLLCIYIVVVCFAFGGSVSRIVGSWLSDDNFSHGPLILLISGYLIWLKRSELKEIIPRSSYIWFVAVFFASIAWVFCGTKDLPTLQNYLTLSIILLSVPIFLGAEITKSILFPLAFLFFSIPFDPFIKNLLMVFSAEFSSGLLLASGLEITKELTFIQTESRRWDVGPQGSGLSYLLATLTISTLFSYLYFKNIHTKIIFVICSCIFCITLNSFRIWVIISYYQYISNGDPDPLLISVTGWIIFAIGLVIILYIGHSLGEKDKAHASLNHPQPEDGIKPRDSKLSIYAAAFGLVAVPFTFYPYAENLFKEGEQIGFEYTTRLAIDDLFHNETADAIKKLQEIIPTSDNYNKDNLVLARALMINNEYLQAEELLDTIIDEEQRNWEAYMLMGWLKKAQGDYIRARRAFVTAEDIRPNDTQPAVQLALLDILQNRTNDARFALQRVFNKDPDSIYGLAILAEIELRHGSSDNVHAIIQKLNRSENGIDIALQIESTLYLRDALKLYQQRDFVAANENISKSLAISPDNWKALLLKGMCNHATGNYQQARESYNEAIGLAPDNANILLGLAKLDISENKPNEARTLLEYAFEKHPKSTAVILALAEFAYEERKDFSMAMEQYETLVRISPDQPLILNNLAWRYIEIGDPRALKFAERAYTLKPDNWQTTHTYGVALLKSGYRERGISLLKKAAAMAPNDIKLQNDLLFAELSD